MMDGSSGGMGLARLLGRCFQSGKSLLDCSECLCNLR